jgi:hypothetical protein
MTYCTKSSWNIPPTLSFEPPEGDTSICAGHGDCVLVTNDTSNVEWYNKYLCQCHDGWTGSADYFDTRVYQQYALTCHTNITIQTILWSIAVVVGTIRFCIITLSLTSVMCRKRKMIRKKPKSLFTFTPFRILTIDFIGSGCMVMVTVLRATTLNALASDVIVSVPAFIGFSFIIYAHSDFTSVEFHTLVSSRSNNFTISATYRKLLLGLAFFYISTISLSNVVGLGLNHSLGPIQNGMFALVFPRYIGLVIWGLGLALAARYVRSQTVLMISDLRNSNSDFINANEAMTNSIDILSFLDSQVKTSMRAFFVIMLVSPILIVPQIWPYQTYGVPFLTITGSIGTNAYLILFRNERKHIIKFITGQGKTSSSITAGGGNNNGGNSTSINSPRGDGTGGGGGGVNSNDGVDRKQSKNSIVIYNNNDNNT